MREHPGREPSTLVIWGAATMLGILAGVGAAFYLWSQLAHTAEPAILSFAVAVIAVGLGLLAFALRAFTGRLFLWALAASMMLAFFAGSGPFSSLSG